MMDFTKIKMLTIGGVELKQLLINGIQVWKSGYKNWVKHSTEADDVTIYNSGKGYKDGYRVRSAGGEAESASSTITGFIRVNPGDIIRIGGGWFGNGYSNGSAINIYDASHTSFGHLSMLGSNYYAFAPGQRFDAYGYESVVKESENVWRWIAPPSEVVYIRVTCNTYSSEQESGPADGTKLIVTINEEIE